MENILESKDELTQNGFSIIHNIYSDEDITQIIRYINEADESKNTFRKSTELFAIRQFLKEMPSVVPLIFNDELKGIISKVFGKDYFVVKSIYFDKPGTSNWYVSYHQDLTISVDKKTNLEGFGSWTVKQNQFAVQPPLAILQNICTIRIHLDDTDIDNGALQVIPASHDNIYRPETINNMREAVTCAVPGGGIMIMKPLLMHSSGRTVNNKNRRVIHIEFSDTELPDPLQWSERMQIQK